MESIHKSTLVGAIIGFICIVVLSLGLYYISCQRQVEMAKLGYEQVQSIGHSDYVWHKAK